MNEKEDLKIKQVPFTLSDFEKGLPDSVKREVNRAKYLAAIKSNPNSEIVSYVDADGNLQRSTTGAGKLSPVDPIAAVAVGGAGLKGAFSVANAIQPTITSILTNPYIQAFGDAAALSNSISNIYSGNIGNNVIDDALTAIGLIPGVPLAKNVGQVINKYYGPLAYRTAWYNNLTPGSYSANVSWHPKGKIKGEIPQVFKDYFLGKGVKQNPKWFNYFVADNAFSSFPGGTKYPQLHGELRDEAFKLYQKIPHKEKYILNTGKIDDAGNKIYTLNLKEIPIDMQQAFINDVNHLKTGDTGVFADLGNYGGNISVTRNSVSEPNKFQFTLTDVFDVEPFRDPNRIAESVPLFLRKILFKQYKNPAGSQYFYGYRNRFPFLENFELSKLSGGKPFRSTTKIQGNLLNIDDYLTSKNSQDPIEAGKRIALSRAKPSDLSPVQQLSLAGKETPIEHAQRTGDLNIPLSNYIDNKKFKFDNIINRFQKESGYFNNLEHKKHSNILKDDIVYTDQRNRHNAQKFREFMYDKGYWNLGKYTWLDKKLNQYRSGLINF